jgi:hypothetical protein
MKDSNKGTGEEHLIFCEAGSQFSRQLNDYTKQRIDHKKINVYIRRLAVDMPHYLVGIVYLILVFKLVPQNFIMVPFWVLGFALVCQVCGLIFWIHKVNKAEKEGIEYLRKAQEVNVSLLRELAKKDYPQEKSSFM